MVKLRDVTAVMLCLLIRKWVLLFNIFRISREGIDDKKVQRAISLFQEKYCSVYHSLRKDLKLSVEYKIGG